MQRLKLLGLALIAVFAFSAAVTAVAAAENSFLPTGTGANPVKFTINSGEGKLVTLAGTEVKCEKDTGKGEMTSSTGGTFKVTFEGCTGPLAVKCADLSHTDAEGIIEVGGNIHQRMGLTGQPLAIMAFEIGPVHFLCSLTLWLALGCVAGEVPSNQINVLESTVSILFTQTGGENTISSVDTEDETGMVTCALMAKKGTGTEETAGEQTTEHATAFEQGGSTVTVLIHI